MFQKINGWHRLFIIASLILFFKIVVFPDHGENSINWKIRAIKQMDDVDCLDLVKKLEAAETSYVGRNIIFDFEVKKYNDGRCFEIRHFYGASGKILTKSVLYTELDVLKSRRLDRLSSAVFVWLGVSLLIYAIGLVFKWVRAGGFK